MLPTSLPVTTTVTVATITIPTTSINNTTTTTTTARILHYSSSSSRSGYTFKTTSPQTTQTTRWTSGRASTLMRSRSARTGSSNNSEQQHRNSLYLSRQTVYHSAEDVRFGSVDSGGDTRTLTGSATGDSLRTTTDALLQDSRANGGLANLPYVARPKPPSATKAFIGGILKPVLLSTEYNEKVPSTSYNYTPFLRADHDRHDGTSHSPADHTNLTTTRASSISSGSSSNNSTAAAAAAATATTTPNTLIVSYAMWKFRVKRCHMRECTGRPAALGHL
ncbi:hypothetical protein AND_007346 [Anopheles darlingi]|uniref:Uncharacterized protein n=1 Tax=Anopheles darlingi TaxID=43151 RepID=W5JAJ5_ANODA|nr:hypothetical protein AND_007346 [Anopheles darlingi]